MNEADQTPPTPAAKHLALVILAVILVAAPWLQIPNDNADGAGMLAHLHSFFVGCDLLYDDEYYDLRMSPLYAFVTSEGVVSNHWPVGATIMQAPGYLLGVLASTLPWLDSLPEEARRWTVPLLAVRSWAIIVATVVLAGIFVWMRRCHGLPAAAAVCAAALVGTPLAYYTFEAPLRPHLWGFVVTTAFVMLWSSKSVGEPRMRAVALGTLVGMASAIRPQLAPLLLLAVHDVWHQAGFTRQRIRNVLICGVSSAPWALVNVNVQYWLYGDALLAYGGGGVSHHLRALMFSTHHGVLTWSPVVALVVVGMVIGVVRKRPAAWLIALLLAHQLWLDAGTREVAPYAVLGSRNWFDGVSFAPRKLLDVMPVMLLPASWLISEAAARRRGRVLAVVTVIAVTPTLLLHLAAFVAPMTTSELMTLPRYASALARGLDPSAWGAAIAQRLVPPRVWLSVCMLATVPIVVASVIVVPRLAWRRSRATLGSFVLVAGLAGVLVHVYVGWLQVRSATALEREPQRMVRAALRMHPAHEAAMAAVRPSQAHMREVLGPDTAPAP